MNQALIPFTAQELAVALVEKLQRGDTKFLRAETLKNVTTLSSWWLASYKEVKFPEVPKD